MKPVRHSTEPCPRFSQGDRLPPLVVGRSFIIVLLLAICLAPARLSGAPPGTGAPSTVADGPQIRISQIYGGGGLANALYQNDFIELHNAGQTAVDVTGWSIQYFRGNQMDTPAFRLDLSGVIPAGGYYLAAGRSANGCNVGTRPCGAPLPTVDAANLTLDIANSYAMVYLVDHQNTLPEFCRGDIAPVDMVGYGTTAPCYEGDGPAPGASNTTAVIRQDAGCQDADQNEADFVAGAPTPRNSAAQAVICVPQAVTLAFWAAHAEGTTVQLTWETVSEVANAGFNIYRGPSATGPWDRVNATLIPAQTPGATDGGQYAWTDAAVEAGATYWYALEDVALDGTLTRHDAVAVTVAGPNAIGLARAHALQERSLPLLLLVAGVLGLITAGARLYRRAHRHT